MEYSENIFLWRSREVVGVGIPLVLVVAWEFQEDLHVEYFIFYNNSEKDITRQRLTSRKGGIEGFAEISLQSLVEYAKGIAEERLLQMRLDSGEQASKWSSFPKLEETSRADLVYLFTSGACRDKLLRIAEMSGYLEFRDLICGMKNLPRLYIND